MSNPDTHRLLREPVGRTAALVKSIIALYLAGASMADIERAYKIPGSRVRNSLKWSGAFEMKRQAGATLSLHEIEQRILPFYAIDHWQWAKPYLLCTSQVLERGWTKTEVEEHLGEPDELGYNRLGKHPLRSYRFERVEAAEREAWWSGDPRRDEKVARGKQRRQKREAKRAQDQAGSPCQACTDSSSDLDRVPSLDNTETIPSGEPR